MKMRIMRTPGGSFYVEAKTKSCLEWSALSGNLWDYLRDAQQETEEQLLRELNIVPGSIEVK